MLFICSLNTELSKVDFIVLIFNFGTSIWTFLFLALALSFDACFSFWLLLSVLPSHEILIMLNRVVWAFEPNIFLLDVIGLFYLFDRMRLLALDWRYEVFRLYYLEIELFAGEIVPLATLYELDTISKSFSFMTYKLMVSAFRFLYFIFIFQLWFYFRPFSICYFWCF